MAGKGLAVAALIVALLALAGMYYTGFLEGGSQATPAKLEIQVEEAPSILVPGKAETLTLKVSNLGGSPAENVETMVEGGTFQVKFNSFTVHPGEVKTVKGEVSASDVQEGLYTLFVRLKYSSHGSQQHSNLAAASIRVVPAVRLTDVGWPSDLLNPFGRSSVERGKSTAVHFRVESLSRNVIYEGLKVKVGLGMDVPGLTITPSEVEIEPLGPKGRSPQYTVTITAGEKTPPGCYPITLTLQTSDGTPIPGGEATVELTVSAP